MNLKEFLAAMVIGDHCTVVRIDEKRWELTQDDGFVKMVITIDENGDELV